MSRTTILVRRSHLVCLMPLLFLIAATLWPREASAQWTLTTSQHQRYLQYYAPLILQRSEEGTNSRGTDWLSNYDFDRDGNFANNRDTWHRLLPQYLAAAAAGTGAYQQWRIRPTLYTAIIEYMNGGTKGVVLLYHVFHPTDKKANEIHDWERVEIHVASVSGTPGSGGEYVAHVTVTRHHDHIMRTAPSADLKFMTTATGSHVMLWQADQDGTGLGAHGHELRFVQDSYAALSARPATSDAEVDITDEGHKDVHYVWVPETSTAAVSAWNAQPISYASANALASGRDDDVDWFQVKRITYELQDLADVYLTHWQGSAWWINWTADVVTDVLLTEPILGETQQVDIPAGLQRFYMAGRDALSGGSDREGVLAKKWFWGGYSAERNADDFPASSTDDFGGFEGLGRDSLGRTRADASGDYASLNAYWRQHDFFLHNGAIDTRERYEAGTWLVGSWYQAASGGFDGRWARLFADRVSYEATPPLRVTFSSPGSRCREAVWVTANGVGGRAPYTYAWTDADPMAPGSPRAMVSAYQPGTVTVRSADGQTVIAFYTHDIYCRPGENIP